MITERHKKILDIGVTKGILPSNVSCPNNCKFCFFHNIEKIFPNLTEEYIPRYNNESFDYFYNKVLENETEVYKNPCAISPVGMIYSENNKMYHYRHCDFFSIGLTLEQIEKIIDLNKKHNRKTMVSTTGYNLEPETSHYLSEKYPHHFLWRISVITFNEKIKKELMINYISSEKLKRIIENSENVFIFLLYFNFKQIIEDIKFLDGLEQINNIKISKMFYNKYHPEIIKKVSKENDEDFKKLIYYLHEHKKEFKDIKKLLFHSPSEAFAWKHKDFLTKTLNRYNLTKKDLILCSKAAYKAIRDLIPDEINVFPIKDSLEGSTTMAATILTKDIINELIPILKKNEIKRVFLPDSIWGIKENAGDYDYNAVNKNNLIKMFPDIEMILIEIPYDILDSNLSLQDCYDYYEKFEPLNTKD